MEFSLIQIAGTLGVGAFLGTLIFICYRIDRKSTEKMWRESKKFTEDRLTEIIESDQKTREEHTKVLSELTTYLKLKNGSR